MLFGVPLGSGGSYDGIPNRQSTITNYGTSNKEVRSLVQSYLVNNFSTDVQRGDILCNSGHVGIAIGNGMMIDSAAAGTDRRITKRAITAYFKAGSTRVVRFKSNVLTEDQLSKVWYEEGKSSTGGIVEPGPGGGGSDDPIDDDSITYHIKPGVLGNADKFYYNGIPLSGQYLGKVDDDWIFNLLENILDWLVGIITLAYKGVIVGWATIIQNLATAVAFAITGESAENVEPLTAEKILFNQVPILDVNFFNTQTAGGKDITKQVDGQDSIELMLRKNVSGLYIAIRNIIIAVMLVILIYIGIRMAISSIAREKAIYRKMFVGWLVGFIIVIFIHFFMVFVLNVNEAIIDLVASGETEGIFVYDEARSMSYEIPASKGWPGAILYVFLVYYLVKLLIFYFKRLFMVYILVLMAPIMGASYAMEMIKGKSKSFKTWMKEFAFNVLIQSIHIIIYSIFMTIIYKLMLKSSLLQLLGTSIIMVLIINLMLRSEKIVKQIFGLKSNTVKDIIDTAINASESLLSIAAITRPMTAFAGRKIENAYDKNLRRQINEKYAKYELPKDQVASSELATDIQRKIDKMKEEEFQKMKQFDKNTLKLGKNVLSGVAGMFAAAPMMFEAGPVEGTLQIVNSASALNSRLDGIKDYDIDQDKLFEVQRKYKIGRYAEDSDTERSQTPNPIPGPEQGPTPKPIPGPGPNSKPVQEDIELRDIPEEELIQETGSTIDEKSDSPIEQDKEGIESNKIPEGETPKELENGSVDETQINSGKDDDIKLRQITDDDDDYDEAIKLDEMKQRDYFDEDDDKKELLYNTMYKDVPEDERPYLVSRSMPNEKIGTGRRKEKLDAKNRKKLSSSNPNLREITDGQGQESLDSADKNKKYTRKLNSANSKTREIEESNNRRRRGIPGPVLAMATARTSTRVKNTIWDGDREGSKIDNPLQEERIATLAELQRMVLEEEKNLHSAMEDLKKNGFPPVYYIPKSGEDQKTVAMNMALKSQYSKQFKEDLQRVTKGASVSKEDVTKYLAEYYAKNGKKPENLNDINDLVEDIVKDKEIEIDANFDDNLKDTISDDFMQILEKHQAEINAERIKEEFASRVANAAEQEGWDKETASAQIRSMMNNQLTNEVIQSLSAKEISDILSDALSRVGSVKTKPASKEFSEVAKSAEKIADLNRDIEKIGGKEVISTKELVENIVTGKDISNDTEKNTSNNAANDIGKNTSNDTKM